MCKLLVENGCDISIQDSAHKTAIHYAKTGSKAEVVDYLTSQLYKNRDKRRANTEAKNHCTKPVEEKSAETSSNTTNGKTLLFRKSRRRRILQLLLPLPRSSISS
jgi:ankyrin repeat protein